VHAQFVSARPAHYNTRYKFELSPRQRQVLDLISRGRTNAEIADSLGVSLDGAKYHVREILGKLGVDSREEAASYWHAYNRPTARLARALSGVFGLGTLKAVVGGAAIIAAGGAVAAIVVGINAARQDTSGGEPAATIPPEETPNPPPATTTPEPSPTAETPEQFAARIAALVSSGQLDELLALSEPVTFTCPGPTPQGAGGPFPLCDGAAPGEERQGYLTAVDASEAETVDPATFSERASDTLVSTLALASLGTATSGDSLALGFEAADGSAVYLAFDALPGQSPQLRALASTTLQAPAILTGGQATLITGPTTFQPLN
jgi:DNA-binding CsgD family transcriptional regulator